MKYILLIILAVFTYNINAQEQITNFQWLDGDQGANPDGFIEFNDKLFFTAVLPGYGREIWMSDGTADSATLLKDIYPGNKSGIQTFSPVVFNNHMYFVAIDGKSNGELWKSDGTSQGTIKVTNFMNVQPNNLTVVQDHLFYITKNSGNTWNVWKSDGTAAGTSIVIEVDSSTNPSYEGELNNLFLFTLRTPNTNESRLWRSDGTDSGTYPLMDNAGGNGSGISGTSVFTNYIKFNNELYFVIRSSAVFGNNSVGIMKTDGFLENTVPVKGIHNGSEAGGYSGLITYGSEIVINDKVYFSFWQEDFNRLFIWETDGTELNTTLIYDEVFSTYFVPSQLSKKENLLVFTTGNNSGGTVLTAIDINSYEITEIKELANGLEPQVIFSTIRNPVVINEVYPNSYLIIVPFDRSVASRYGWISDLTETGTSNISNLNEVRNVFLFSDYMYFPKHTNGKGIELWRSDATQEGTFLLDNINIDKPGIDPIVTLSKFNNKLLFRANDGNLGQELWYYDKGNSNLGIIKDILEGERSSWPSDITHLNDHFYFIADNSINGRELWKSDGTNENTVLAHDIVEGEGSSSLDNLINHLGNLYFTARMNSNYFLYKKSGENIEAIQDLGTNLNGIPDQAQQLVSSGSNIFISTYAGPEKLWKSDGTVAGTIMLKEFREIGPGIDVAGTFFFTATTYENENEIELYKSDGTPEGTVLVKDIEVGYSSAPENLTNHNGILYFSAKTSTNGRELWRSDGTESGTYQILDIYPGPFSSISGYSDHFNNLINESFSIINDEVIFRANNNINGNELWKSDGTINGTLMVSDINPGAACSNPSNMAIIGNTVYFQAYQPTTGMELWKSDGSQDGTILVADILAGSANSNPSSIIELDNSLFLIGDTFENGRQIWQVQDDLTLGVSDLVKESMTLYPNPSSDFVKISYNKKIDKINLYNVQGIYIKEIDLIEENKFNVSELSSGLYLILLESEGNKFIKKLIVR